MDITHIAKFQIFFIHLEVTIRRRIRTVPYLNTNFSWYVSVNYTQYLFHSIFPQLRPRHFLPLEFSVLSPFNTFVSVLWASRKISSWLKPHGSAWPQVYNIWIFFPLFNKIGTFQRYFISVSSLKQFPFIQFHMHLLESIPWCKT